MYYIYHIPGVKIGCTKDLEKRMSDQEFTEWQILETHEDIHVASDREIELQKEYGYRLDDIPYWQSVENRYKFTKEDMAKGGRTNVASGHIHAIQDLAQAARKQIVQCPHCNKKGAKFNMTRYHFDNCKLSFS
tara:strand:+ start:3024 stop:3422 length:399 start_codon:yes stop_codon:yes gene_type:complete